jgi:wyosine [tRNA(Phe)-imidazoG37] synthetase (radical SAM superfamily)
MVHEMKYLFGPVPSRRLGLSLGVDVTPYKTCTLNCTYCQLGRTTCLTLKRDKYVPKDEVLKEIESVSEETFDCLTFAGSGEPTLHSDLGEIIRDAKEILDVPIVVITNGTLFSSKQVRDDVADADIILPSLDAATQKTFQRVNRPHPDLKIDEVIKGLKALRDEFTKEIWLEVMLVKGVNDQEAQTIADVAKSIGPDRIQLNTVIRPAYKPVLPLSYEEMENILKFFDDAEIISEEMKASSSMRRKESLLELLLRRPCTIDEMSTLLNIHRNELIKYVAILEREDKIVRRSHRGKLYFQRSSQNAICDT